MIKVIVTQRIDYIKNYSETRESIDQALSEWLIQADYLPIPISNKLVSIHNNQDIQVNEQPLLQNWLSVIKPNGNQFIYLFFHSPYFIMLQLAMLILA